MKSNTSKQDKVDYKDISLALKVGIWGGWVAALIYGVSFLIGLIEGLFIGY